MRSVALLILLVAAGIQSLGAQAQPATVIIVRHAEKAAEPKADPPLSEVGRARVQKLLQVVRDAGVNVIYTTNRLRNLQTARPIAEALQLPVVELPIVSDGAAAHAHEVAARIRSDAGGLVVLVVGHSNTLGPVIEQLGGPRVEEIPDEQYDDVFVLTVQDGAPARLLRARY